MADEARISSGIAIRIVSSGTTLLDYQSRPATFVADVSTPFGPTPGAMLVGTDGTDVDLSELTAPGLCWIHNMDPNNYVTVGIRDPERTLFYPLIELLPGESYPLRLSRIFGEEYTSTGTTAATNKLHIMANTAPCTVRVDAFET